MRPADPDDIDARFEALVAQFGEDEIQRMEALAARLPRSGRRRTPVVMLAVLGVVAVAGAIISLRPDLFSGDAAPAPSPRPPAPAILRPAEGTTEPPVTGTPSDAGTRDATPPPSTPTTSTSLPSTPPPSALGPAARP
ncbi:hypothetical protein [Microtetraspora niveoalba]|uniref:hypothetical protein n=1 Tax=Microtetraspora niveoalba TaxID=46175 RepID=UPI00082ECF35|nr:hypothetical protein [Microtetraspora niveoalba]